jgi:hypothetical protein
MIIQRPFSFLAMLGFCAFLVGLTGAAEAKEFTFIAQELGKGMGAIEMGEQEIWLPTAVVIDQKEDLNSPLWFVLENPTAVDHEFAVGGLFMFLTEEIVRTLSKDPLFGKVLAENMMVPIRLTIKAGETKKIHVAPVGIEGEKSLGARYQFFCPKHKDIRVSGFVFVD